MDRCEYQVPGTHHITDTFDNHEKLEAGPAAKGRDNKRQMRLSNVSSVLSRRATSTAPAQRENCRCSSVLSRWDHEKQNIVFLYTNINYETEKKKIMHSLYEYAS